MKVLESILDFPQQELCNVVWDKRDDGTYTLAQNARKHVMLIVKWVCNKYNLSNLNVRINGSICSNSYSNDSDIDIHLSKDSMSFEEAEYYFNKVREDFRDEFVVKYPQLAEIDGYRFEVCFQTSGVKDLMSVGCYDVLNDKWLVGPQIKDLDFDPYEEYYLDDIQFISNSLIAVRRNAMELREKALVFVSTRSKQLKQTLSHELVELMKTSELLFNHLREIRKTISDRVNSPETANEIANSKEWKIADSAHKLITKFGYFEILRNARHFLSEYESGEMTMLDVANSILETTNEHFNYRFDKNDSQLLSESKIGIDESMANFSRNMFLAAIFSIAGIVSFESLAANLEDLNITNVNQIEKEIEKLQVNNNEHFASKDGNTLNAYHAANCVATTLFKEGADQVAKAGQISIDAIASTIYTRAKKNKENIIKAISKDNQYSEWRAGVYKGGWDDNTYTNQLPANLENSQTQKVWRLDCQTAVKLLRGEFESVIGDRDMIANISLDSAGSFFKWGIKCDICIGDHWFGKGDRNPADDPDVTGIPDDPNVILMKRSHHKVVSGETVSKIAKDYGVTVNWIKIFNPSIKDLTKISIGQDITIVKMVQKTSQNDVTEAYLKKNANYISKACSKLDKYRNEQIAKNKKVNQTNKKILVKPQQNQKSTNQKSTNNQTSKTKTSQNVSKARPNAQSNKKHLRYK